MPRFRTEREYVVGDMTWLGSGHGIRNARTEILDISTFTAATHYPNGFIPSGTALAKVSGMMVPYVSGGSGGAEVLAGFLLTDQPLGVNPGATATEDFNVPVLDHGRIKTGKLPFAWVAPTSAANNKTTCVFI